MQLKQMTVTPAMARKWLAASEGVRQRNLSKARVARYVQDMRNGHWQLTHQPIALTAEGLILDGQHRLAAVVQADLPQPFLVARGADPSTFDVIDTGRARNAPDALRISGMHNVNVKAAIGRLVLIYDQVKGSTTAPKNVQVTSPDIMALWEGPRAPILGEAERSADRLARALDRSGIKTWGAGLWVVITEARASSQQRDQFWEHVATGAELPQGSPILSFRRWIMANTGPRGILTQDRPFNFLANGIKCWNDWVAGKERGLSIWKQGREAMPMVVARPSQPKLEDVS